MAYRPGTIGKLVLSAANRVLREIVIDRRRLSIGRRPYNDLLLDDLTVSGEHAIVHTVDGESIIHDLKSRNGTLVNGVPILQQELADGDSIDVGIYRLLYRTEVLTGLDAFGLASKGGSGGGSQGAAGAPVPRGVGRGFGPPVGPPVGAPGGGFGAGGGGPGHGGGAEHGMGAGFGAAGGSGVGRDATPRSRPADTELPLIPASLHFLSGHDAGRRQALERPIVSVRNGSGQVAVVGRRNNGYFLTHVEGLAYPLVNGESIGLGAHALQRNDLIELAGTIIQFCYDT